MSHENEHPPADQAQPAAPDAPMVLDVTAVEEEAPKFRTLQVTAYGNTVPEMEADAMRQAWEFFGDQAPLTFVGHWTAVPYNQGADPDRKFTATLKVVSPIE